MRQSLEQELSISRQCFIFYARNPGLSFQESRFHAFPAASPGEGSETETLESAARQKGR